MFFDEERLTGRQEWSITTRVPFEQVTSVHYSFLAVLRTTKELFDFRPLVWTVR